MKKTACLLLSFLVLFPLSCAIAAPGQHNGEQKQLDVDIQFINSQGTTVTNAQGTFYNFWGITMQEDKVYPSRYWGEFPLYFFDEMTGINIRVTNTGPREKAKIRIVTEAYSLRTDGSSGVRLMVPAVREYEILRGETKLIDASFSIPYTPESESGLDRFIVKVMHVNEGGGPGNAEPALIMQKEGVFCQPKK